MFTAVFNRFLFLARKHAKSRRLLLVFFCKLHNLSYHWVAYMASYGGVHPKHRIMNYHQFFVERINHKDSVLDIGCSSGELSVDLAKYSSFVVGIEIVPNKVEQAKLKHQAPNLEYIVGDATTYCFDRTFDVAVLSNVLEHIEDRKDFLRKLHKVCSRLLVRVPLVTRDWIACYKKEQGLPYLLDRTHFIEYTEEEFHSEAKEASWRIVETRTRFGEYFCVLESEY